MTPPIYIIISFIQIYVNIISSLQLLSHKHSISDPGHVHSIDYGYNADSRGDNYQGTGSHWGTREAAVHRYTTGVTVQGVTGAAAGDELRPNNYTKRIWVRVS